MESGYITAEELGIQNHICVLPYGENTKNRKALWSTTDLKPYQSYLIDGRTYDRLFQGFIFNPINGREDHYIYPTFANFGELADKEDWKIALLRLFENKYNLDALARNTKSGFKTDVWITLPYPNSLQEHFGSVNGRNLNFKNENDREEAIKWWVSRFQKMWNQAAILHESLIFRGFVWQRTSISNNDIELVKKVNAYIHSNGYLSLWLQQYGSCGCPDWKEFGFDASCTHPNFYGNTDHDFSWIANSTVFANHYRLGMQIVFGKGELFKDRHLYDHLNYGIYNDYMRSSLLVYQFPNQTMAEIYQNHPDQYIALYSFIKKTYKPVYPTAAFPA
ncbi:DUF4855 domain-containing protein [Bacillus sp. FJAT-49736]|uniref:DUF4855 domain-containing protein n=1 Tax=Bacillus sp. FJAT-49736 TaxID=2833582 RepID=UPI001BCA3B3F|nr:DUF4855 domain-containing protein [Bacillus sp. FJAT-49736]MBS4172214.1 DUF4855 domain-containing protein [Bacillus sp. FJAT-49736]